mmetsp:Transcript_13753/g.44015  ORF Transcript_13753/g.44015 Transcript_13753/m.44015 type:complete len:270 (+) Transcript_13753:577-1386(+)
MTHPSRWISAMISSASPSCRTSAVRLSRCTEPSHGLRYARTSSTVSRGVLMWRCGSRPRLKAAPMARSPGERAHGTGRHSSLVGSEEGCMVNRCSSPNRMGAAEVEAASEREPASWPGRRSVRRISAGSQAGWAGAPRTQRPSPVRPSAHRPSRPQSAAQGAQSAPKWLGGQSASGAARAGEPTKAGGRSSDRIASSSSVPGRPPPPPMALIRDANWIAALLSIASSDHTGSGGSEGLVKYGMPWFVARRPTRPGTRTRGTFLAACCIS